MNPAVVFPSDAVIALKAISKNLTSDVYARISYLSQPNTNPNLSSISNILSYLVNDPERYASLFSGGHIETRVSDSYSDSKSEIEEAVKDAIQPRQDLGNVVNRDYHSPYFKSSQESSPTPYAGCYCQD